LHESSCGGAFLLKVESTINLGIAGNELISFVQLLTADDTYETPDMIDSAHRAHNEFIGRYRFHTTTAPNAIESEINIPQNNFYESYVNKF
jgi:hypothetical protein